MCNNRGLNFKRHLPIILLALALLPLFPVLGQANIAVTATVAAVQVGCGSSIQAAIDNAEPADTMLVSSCTY